MTTDHRQPPSLAFPTSQPAGTALVRVESDARIATAPTWSIHTLNAGPSRSAPAYNQHLQATVGSSYDWSDELRFDKRTGRLASFILKTPEAGLVDPAIAASWLALPRRSGLPVLEDRENGFHVDPLHLRFLSEDAGALVATRDGLAAADGDSLRLAIDPEVDLLFQAGRYGGWILRNPVAHLVTEPGNNLSPGDDPTLRALLREYLTLAVEPNIGKMSDEDPALGEALRGLHARAQALTTPQARVLEHVIGGVLEIFYPQ